MNFLFFKVVVVPDNVTAQKVPKIAGLLEYRQDQKKLYLRANKTWNLLTQEKEVIQRMYRSGTRLYRGRGGGGVVMSISGHVYKFKDVVITLQKSKTDNGTDKLVSSCFNKINADC